MFITQDDIYDFFGGKLTRQDIDIDNKLNNIYNELGDNLYCLIQNSKWFKELIENYIIDNFENYVDDIIDQTCEYGEQYADEQELIEQPIAYFIQIGLYNCDKIYLEAIENLLDMKF